MSSRTVQDASARWKRRQASDDTAMMDAVDEINATLLSLSASTVDVAELFNAAVFTPEASSFKLTPGTSYDLREGYNLGDPEVQKHVWADLKQQKPRLVIGSPPCSAFSSLQNLKPGGAEYEMKVQEGLRHLIFCMEVYAWQLAEGRLFLHEHPHGAWSWQVPEVVHVQGLEGVLTVVGDQCMFDQKVDGEFVLKDSLDDELR